MISKLARIKEGAGKIGLHMTGAFLGINFDAGPVASKDANEILPNFAERIYHILTQLAYPLAFAAIIYTAYILLTSLGKPEGYERAKKNLIYLVTGIGLIVFTRILYALATKLFG